MQIVTLYGTRSAAASGQSIVLCRDGSKLASYTRDLLSVERENLLVSYPILVPWNHCDGPGTIQEMNLSMRSI